MLITACVHMYTPGYVCLYVHANELPTHTRASTQHFSSEFNFMASQDLLCSCLHKMTSEINCSYAYVRLEYRMLPLSCVCRT
jgi:hypothetical protein